MRIWRKGDFCAQLFGMQIETATIENSMGAPQKFSKRTITQSSNSTQVEFSLKKY